MKTKEQIQVELLVLKDDLDFILSRRDLTHNNKEFRGLAEAAHTVAQKIQLLEWVLEDSK